MQTQKPAENKSEQYSGRVSNNLKNVPASQKPITKKNTVRTTEYKKMIEICLTDPDSVTRDEFVAFQSAIGYGQTVRLMEEGKRRKIAGKGEKKGSETTSAAEKSAPDTNAAKADPKGITKENSLTKTIIDMAKPKENVIKPVAESEKTKSNKAESKAVLQMGAKAEQKPVANIAKKAVPKAAVQTVAKATNKVQKPIVQAATKAADAIQKPIVQAATKVAHAVQKPVVQIAAKAATQMAKTPAAQIATKAATQVAKTPAAQIATKAATQVAKTPAAQIATKAEAQVAKTPMAQMAEKAAVQVAKTPAAQIATKAAQVAKKPVIQTAAKATKATPKTAVKADNKQEAKTEKKVATQAAGGAGLGKEQGGAKGASAQKINDSLKPKREVKPAPKITGEDPGKILNQLGSADATQVVNTFSQATSASKGAFDKERDKTQKLLPKIPAPTGLEPVKKQGNINKKQSPLQQKVMSAFKAAKTGGKALEGNIQDFNLPEREELDADDVMKEAKACNENPPEIGMTGEADPSQIEGFEEEASGSVQDSKKAEVEQIKKEFGENNIAPLVDNTILKATDSIRPAEPLKLDIKKMAPIKPEVASRVDPSVNDTLQKYMNQQTGEYEKGKSEYDAGVVAEKASADQKIEGHKAEAKEKQLAEQDKAKADVDGYRGQWQSEIDQATSEYDNEANTEVEGKRKEVGNIKEEKDGEVKSTLKTAENDAEKECDTAKKDADKKEKEGEEEKEKKKKGWFGRALDWIGDGLKAIGEGIKKAVSGIFNALRSAVKTIFEKAKKAALALIEAGRKLIVTCIKGLGEILKKLVTKLLAKFPGIAKKICGFIDAAVNKAVEAVNKIADGLKKAVTAVLDFMAKGFDNLFAGLQKLYNGIMSGLKKFLSMDFMKILEIALEAAMIAAEIAAAFATGGGSVLLQIGKWLATTLPGLINKAKAIMGFVNTIKSINFGDIKNMIKPSGIADFLVKGLFGELKALPGAESEKGEKGAPEPASGGAEKGLMKVLSTLTNVFNKIKGVYGKFAGAVNKVLPTINITNKKWFNPFSMIYAGVAKVVEVVQNPAEALGEGVGNLQAAAGNFFGGIKTKISGVAGDIKEKVAILGKPAELLKVILNKGVDMVLNFIIMNPPSALLKAIFKLIEAVAGKSLVELIRQTIPFADALLNKVSESGPVQAIASPLKAPISKVSGAIDQVTSGVTGVVDDAEQKATSAFGSGEKLISGFIGGKGGSKGGGGKGGGGGDFFGTLKSGIHTRLMRFGEANLLKKGTSLAKKGLQKGKELVVAGAKKGKEVILGLKRKFSFGGENHEMWVEKQGLQNVVMMASKADKIRKKIKGFKEKAANIKVDTEKDKIVKLIEQLEQSVAIIETTTDETKKATELDKAVAFVKEIGKALKSNPRTRLPKSDGHWEGEVGNSKWYSDKDVVKSITGGKGVEYKNGRPDFSPWKDSEIPFEGGKLTGTREDFKLVYEYIKEKYKLRSNNAAKSLLKDVKLTPHHYSNTIIQLIPTDLHANMPHIGSASDLRGGY